MEAVEIPAMITALLLMFAAVGAKVFTGQLIARMKHQISHVANIKQEVEWLGESFEDFLANTPKEHLMNQLYMFSPSFDVDEAVERIAQCSHFVLTEALAAGVEELATRLDLPLKALHVRQTAVRHGITEDQLRALRSLLQPECEMLEKLAALRRRRLAGA